MGGARTALFNFLFARASGGTFVLRIEDTDRQRSSEEMTRAIVDSMEWLGLEVDEGPLHQADGVQRHRRDALRLLEEGHAYRCFCTPEELKVRRTAAEEAEGGFRYDGRCRRVEPEEAAARAEAGQPYALRFALPEGATGWNDLVHGSMEFDHGHLDDFIVLRSDGTPVYNMAVVSDDIAMRISHVIRGDDHLSNTPKQLLIYGALGADPPAFAHVPMILGPDGKRLSKRHGALSVEAYREEGFLPEAMVNFLALLGWSPGDDRQVMDLPDLIEAFSLERILKKSAVFDVEKLTWLNGQHISRAAAERLIPLVEAAVVATGRASPRELEERRPVLHRAVELAKERARTIDELVVQVAPFVAELEGYEEAAVRRFWKKPEAAAEALRAYRDRLEELPEWEPEALETALRGLAKELEVGAGKIIHPLRVALTGTVASPGIFAVLELMGRERTLARIEGALGYLDAKGAAEPA